MIDIPYDGKSIGEFISDAIRNITGEIVGGLQMAVFHAGHRAFYARDETPRLAQNPDGPTGFYEKIVFDAGLVVPVSHENRPASISTMTCITF